MTILLLTSPDLTASTDLDNGNTTAQLGQSLLQLGPVVFTTRLDGILGTITVEKDGVLGDGDGTSRPEKIKRSLVKFDVELVRKDCTTDGEATENRPAVVTEARCLDGSDLKLTTQLVENTSSQRLSVSVLGNDHQRTTRLCSRFQ